MAWGFTISILDRLILFPNTEDMSHSGVRRFDLEPECLDVWESTMARHENPDFVVLHFHGNASRAESESLVFAPLWVEQKATLLTANLPGYGTSPGPASFERFIPDATRTLRTLKQKFARDVRIVLSGNSIGTIVALGLAASIGADSLFLLNPPPVRDMIVGDHGWWNLGLVASTVASMLPDELDSIRNASSEQVMQIPMLMITSEHDEIVKVPYQDQIFECYRGPKTRVILPGASHNVDVATDYKETVISKFASILSATP